MFWDPVPRCAPVSIFSQGVCTRLLECLFTHWYFPSAPCTRHPREPSFGKFFDERLEERERPRKVPLKGQTGLPLPTSVTPMVQFLTRNVYLQKDTGGLSKDVRKWWPPWWGLQCPVYDPLKGGRTGVPWKVLGRSGLAGNGRSDEGKTRLVGSGGGLTGVLNSKYRK